MTNSLTWYGHGTFGLILGESRIIIDPFFSHNPSSPKTPEEIEANYILVTHGHFDHIGDAVNIAKRCDATIIANAEIAGWLSKQKVKTHAQQIGGGFQHPFGYLKLTLAIHGSRLPDGSYGGIASGFLLTTHTGKKLYFAGDTGLFGDMNLIGEEGIYLAALPIGDNYTMGPHDALRALKMLKPKVVVPMHYNTWPLIEQDVDAWKQLVESETDTVCHIFQPGDNFEF